MIFFPWLELTLLLPLIGAAQVGFIKTPTLAARWCAIYVAVTLACAAAAAITFALAPTGASFLGVFTVDNIAAPMLPVLSMLHLLVILGTAKARVSSNFCVRVLLSASFTMAAVTSQSGTLLVSIMVLVALLPVWDMKSRGQRTRGFQFYMVPFIAMLLLGWAFVDNGNSPVWSLGLLVLALKLCGGIVPLHGWLPALFKGAAFGTALLFVLPLIEVVAALRLVLPFAPSWMLQATSVACLITAVYAGGMAIVQREVRRFFAYLCLSQTSLVMFAVMLHTSTAITAALCLWISAILSLSGLGFSLRALEARFGELSLREYHGFFQQVPGLAVCFLVAGLACVGFPGTIGFVPMELLISGSVDQGLGVSVTLAFAAMFNAIAIMRAYFALFTGKRPTTSVSLQITSTERIGITLIVLVVFLGGWFSPGVVASRHRVADNLLLQRHGGHAPAEASH